MINLAKEIGLDENLISRICNISEKDKNKAYRLAKKCSDGNFACLNKENHIIRLSVILNCAVRAREEYRKRDIPDSIFLDTVSDIKIWCENNGNKGLKNHGWLKNHVKCELFRLGRLQFQLCECKNKTLLYNKLPFSYGEELIYVHIPQGERLDTEKCKEAFLMAEEFFSKHFPDYKYRYYFCESWLLYEGNKDFMAENSNILAFASLFDHRYSVKIDEQAIERVFGKRRIFRRNYPENTSLQRSLKKYMLDGSKAGVGIGIIDRNIFLTMKNK